MKNRHGYLINNKVKIKGAPKNKRGLTLMELMISLALVSLVLAAAYSFLGTTNKFFNIDVKRSDAQSQLRLIMDGLKKEVGTSSSVKISSNSSVTPGSTERMFYSGTTSGSSYTLLLKTTGGITPAFGDMELKSFSITFSTSVASPKMLTVTMSTSEGYSLTGTILAPNVSSIIGPDGVLTGNTLTCVSASPVSLPTSTTYTDLVNFEKNTFNIVGTNAFISCTPDVNFSPSGSLLIQGENISFSGIVKGNLNATIAIKATTLNLGSGQYPFSTQEDILDVKQISGWLSNNNPIFYVTKDIVGSRPSNVDINSNNWNKIEDYKFYDQNNKEKFWRYLFANPGDGSIKAMTIRTLKDSISYTVESL